LLPFEDLFIFLEEIIFLEQDDMNTTIIDHAHITRKSVTDEPQIRGTGTSVRAIAELWLQGAQPEEIQLHLPHITIAQIFDALCYYNDNKDEMDSLIRLNAVPEELSGTRLS